MPGYFFAMTEPSLWNAIAQQISQVTGQPFTVQERRSVSGGCINQGYCLLAGERKYFVKINQTDQLPMFQGEALGLEAMAATNTMRVPQPICYGSAEQSSYLVLEWLEFSRGNNDSWHRMGQNLAALHLASGSNQFGWPENNTIGSTPQLNPWTDSWADFFAEHRIGYQLTLARRRGGNFPDPALVIPRVKELLGDRQPAPALVHGDLWSGNGAILTTGEPVIFDPANYYGDPEVDIAMTELFGGFPSGFYQGYNAVNPPSAGYQKRKTLYNLYHILNHFNLFGGGYGAQAQQMLQQCLGKV
jgi:fructosamine-3-kinase